VVAARTLPRGVTKRHHRLLQAGRSGHFFNKFLVAAESAIRVDWEQLSQYQNLRAPDPKLHKEDARG
jgi:hypothetical protein